MKRIPISDEEIIAACNGHETMAKAASRLKLHFNTFKRRASVLGCYNPNKPPSKIEGRGKFHLQDILDGKHPQYQTFKLKHRLFEIGLKQNCCEECGTDSWNGKSLECELDHIDGDRTNHVLSNLKVLCPNCHSQTSTFRAKNINAPVR